jgi:hypothetical protein
MLTSCGWSAGGSGEAKGDKDEEELQKRGHALKGKLELASGGVGGIHGRKGGNRAADNTVYCGAMEQQPPAHNTGVPGGGGGAGWFLGQQ